MQSIWRCCASELLGSSACARHSKKYAYDDFQEFFLIDLLRLVVLWRLF